MPIDMTQLNRVRAVFSSANAKSKGTNVTVSVTCECRGARATSGSRYRHSHLTLTITLASLPVLRSSQPGFRGKEKTARSLYT